MFIKIFLLCCLVSAIGFIKLLYFISYGYGNSISVVGLYLLLSQKDLTIEEIIIGILYIIYGIRLSLFLFIRNRNEKFIEKMKDRNELKKEPKLSYKIIIWLSVALLYACQTSPLAFRIISNKKEKESIILLYIGIIISILGLFIEIVADNQKSSAKNINPKRFVDIGLYKYIRCPNYLGEIIFWTGNLITCINVYNGFFQLFIIILGYIGIVFVMFRGARRIEIHQNKNYGNDKQYKEYIKKTPILIPFVPIYSLEKYFWLRA